MQSKKKITRKNIKILLDTTGEKLEKEVETKHLWCGRHVKNIDGSTVSMPDTIKNQEAYPQHSSQKKGCGFPLAKIGVLFSYATGAVVGIAIDVFKTHDIKLARQLTEYLDPGNVLLGDRAFCSYTEFVTGKVLLVMSLFDYIKVA